MYANQVHDCGSISMMCRVSVCHLHTCGQIGTAYGYFLLKSKLISFTFSFLRQAA